VIVSVSVLLPVFDGAVYRPSGVIEPSSALHVTEEFNAFVTVAVNWADWPLFSVSAAGFTITVVEDTSVIVAGEYALVSA
jgi:hypothetical protein